MIKYSYKTDFSLVNAAHEFHNNNIEHGDVVIDATVGNGHDTLFLAQHVGTLGKVFGFDIQQGALFNTQARLVEAGISERVSLHLMSHACMAAIVEQQAIKAIMFNLGYLPGGNKTVITKVESTLSALKSATNIITPAGGISIIAYPGHPGGQHETDVIKQWYQTLDAHRFKLEVTFLQAQNTLPPQLILISKTS